MMAGEKCLQLTQCFVCPPPVLPPLPWNRSVANTANTPIPYAQLQLLMRQVDGGERTWSLSLGGDFCLRRIGTFLFYVMQSLPLFSNDFIRSSPSLSPLFLCIFFERMLGVAGFAESGLFVSKTGPNVLNSAPFLFVGQCLLLFFRHIPRIFNNFDLYVQRLDTYFLGTRQ